MVILLDKTSVSIKNNFSLIKMKNRLKEREDKKIEDDNELFPNVKWTHISSGQTAKLPPIWRTRTDETCSGNKATMEEENLLILSC